jgi:hypothetical protein
MKILIKATSNTKRIDTSFMNKLVHRAFNNVSNADAPYINIFEELNDIFKEKSISLIRTDDTGQWKYGDVSIKQSFFSSDFQIYIECGDDFFETNQNQLDYLIRVLSQIYVHESKHKEQYINSEGYLSSGDAAEDDYYGLPYEIEAHAADAVEGFIQIGYDPLEIYTQNSWDEYAPEIESCWVYWDSYGRYDDDNDCPIWQKFLSEFKDAL